MGLLLCAVREVFLLWKQGLLNLQSSELLLLTSFVIWGKGATATGVDTWESELLAYVACLLPFSSSCSVPNVPFSSYNGFFWTWVALWIGGSDGTWLVEDRCGCIISWCARVKHFISSNSIILFCRWHRVCVKILPLGLTINSLWSLYPLVLWVLYLHSLVCPCRGNVLKSITFQRMNKRKRCFHLISGLLRTFSSIIKVDQIYSISVTLLNTLQILIYLIFIRLKYPFE